MLILLKKRLNANRSYGFTLIELLVTIAIIALLLSILLPALAQARRQAKVVAVQAELYSITLALETYALDNQEHYPPTRADCSWNARAHWFALPAELAGGNYLPLAQDNGITFAGVEDRFNLGYTYKYIKVGTRLDYTGSPSTQWLWIPGGFPNADDGTLTGYTDPKSSPVTWVLYSYGPDFDENNLIKSDFPLRQTYWYNARTKQGIITRARMKSGHYAGSGVNY